MLPVYVVLFQLGSIFSDFEIIMKIAGLLFIVSFVRQHIPDRPLLSNVVILGLSAFLLFDVWKIFGSALFLYILVSFGVLHTVVDLSFLGAFQKRPSREEQERAHAAQQRQAQEQQQEYHEQYRSPRQEMEAEEEEEHSSHHMYSQGAAKAHHPGQAKHSSGSLSSLSSHQLQGMLRGGHGGGHGGGGRR